MSLAISTKLSNVTRRSWISFPSSKKLPLALRLRRSLLRRAWSEST